MGLSKLFILKGLWSQKSGKVGCEYLGMKIDSVV